MLNEEMLGRRFGNLTVISEDLTRPNNRHYYICKCDCGRTRSVMRYYLLKGTTKTCGNIKECIYAYMNHSKTRRKSNQYDLSGKYGIGYTSKGEEFYFDLEDFDKIKEFTWYCDSSGYIRTNTFDFEHNKRSYLFMHNYILNLPNDDSLIADHIHGMNTVNDNRKSNLRVVNKWQNNVNQSIRKDNVSGVKGVEYSNSKHTWIARIQKQGKRYYLGNFDTFEDAVKARKDAEKEYFGEYSYDVSQNIMEG